MAEPDGRQGRTRDAERTRRVILDAAEAVFAEHGFDGARFDAIAQAAGYNRSLIGQYFGDKLGLYTAVFERINRDIIETEMGMRILAPLLEDETVISDAQRFRAFLAAMIGMVFDYGLEHPHLMRLIHWEQAEGWQTFTKISPQFEGEDTEQWRELFHKAYRAGLLKSDFEPVIQLVLIEQLCWSYLAALPMCQAALPGEDVSSPAALARGREFIIAFVVRGLMGDPNEVSET